MKDRIATCLWVNKNAGEAAKFYAATFPDRRVGKILRAPGDFPSGKEGDVLTVEFTVLGMPFVGLNGGPEFHFDEAVSFMVYTEDQAETDRYWNSIVDNGGTESVCGWCKDRFGLSWQITPRRLMELMADPDREVTKCAFDAMMQKEDRAVRWSQRRPRVPLRRSGLVHGLHRGPGGDRPLLERHRRQRRHRERLRLVQGPRRPVVADHATPAHGADGRS